MHYYHNTLLKCILHQAQIWFLTITLSWEVGMFLHACVSTPKTTNNQWTGVM